jgi:hypothetical protein
MDYIAQKRLDSSLPRTPQSNSDPMSSNKQLFTLSPHKHLGSYLAHTASPDFSLLDHTRAPDCRALPIRIQFRTDLSLPHQHITPYPPRQDRAYLVSRMPPRRHAKHIIQLLQRPATRLRKKRKDQQQRHNIESRVEPKRARRPKRPQHARKRQRQRRGPEVVGGDRPRHADLAMRQGKRLGAVDEGAGPFARGIEGGEKEDEEGDEADTSLGGGGGHVEGHAGCEESPEHVGEGGEKEGAAAPAVDGVEGWDGENEHGHAEPPGDDEGDLLAEARLDEDGRGVEGDDVD